MASRGGQRAAGTDGTDFMHRERVASHYSLSALNKGRIKWTILFHWMLFFLVVGRLSADFCRLVQVTPPSFLVQLELPPPQLWELAWIPSIMSSMFAHLSLKRNNSSLLWQALLGNFLLGLLPVMAGFAYIYPTVQDYIQGDLVPDKKSFGFIFEVLICSWLAIAFQVHVFQMYFAQQLLGAWSATTKKSK